MQSSLCVDETGYIKAQLYKDNLVSHKYLKLNMTSKKAAQFNSNIQYSTYFCPWI